MAMFGAATMCLILAGYHLIMIKGEGRNKQSETALNLLAPFSLAVSSLLTEKGVYHRNRFVAFLLLSMLFALLFAGIPTAIRVDYDNLTEAALRLRYEGFG